MKVSNLLSKKSGVNFLYFILWFFPLFIFVKNFLSLSELNDIFGKGFVTSIYFSLKQGLLSTFLAFLFGILPAYYAGYSNSFVSKLLNGSIFIPFFFPVISTVTAFSILFNLEFMKNFNILYTLKAILIGNVFYNSPIFVKYISDGIRSIPNEIREGMEIDGANRVEIFLFGEMKLIMPQIIRAGLLVFTYSFLSFGIILSLGGIRFSTLEIEIASTFRGQINFSKGIFYGVIQFGMLMIINFLRFLPKEYFLENKKIKGREIFFLKIISIGYLILEYGIVISSIFFSFYDYYIGKITFKYYKILFSPAFNIEYPIIESFFNSLVVSSIVATIVIVISYVLIKNYNRFTELIIFANVGISGAFLGITLFYMHIVYSMPLWILLILGQIMISIPVAYSFMYQYIKRFPVEISENALLDCNSLFERVIYVELPLLKRIFISTFLQIFAIVLGEFTMAYAMQIEDLFPMVSLVNYSMVANKKYLESAAFTSVILIIVIVLFLFGEYLKSEKN
ncbi:ABC transporter permease [Fusobacterium sp. PH5-44]|uniref:ABC transporter permease n=1 Tax=unclassified Fusobacterium TaxID=2648384 RepID=UPI003D1D7F91